MPRLGRAAGTSYGGAYTCEVREVEAAARLWPQGTVAAGATRVRVWALSDLALLDANGAPCFSPTATMLGLPGDGAFDGADSAIGVRRYAPWNGNLRRRDLERQVIDAGSVFTFTYTRPLAAMEQQRATVGQFQEAGLGRIMVAPPILDGRNGRQPGDPPTFTASAPIVEAVPSPRQPPPQQPAAGSEPVLRWLEAMRILDTSRENAA